MKITEAEQEVIEEYGHLIQNTGGNDIKRLLEREDINIHNNAIATSLQIAVSSQVTLLRILKAKDLLKEQTTKENQ